MDIQLAVSQQLSRFSVGLRPGLATTHRGNLLDHFIRDFRIQQNSFYSLFSAAPIRRLPDDGPVSPDSFPPETLFCRFGGTVGVLLAHSLLSHICDLHGQFPTQHAFILGVCGQFSAVVR